ncbi:MAG: DUF4124 domain-containing protein [Pseudomonadota bacterium]
MPPHATLFLLFLLLSSGSAAQTVYRSVEDGVTRFSDVPPEGVPTEVIELDVATPANDPALEERITAMRETTRRMADDRRERERHRAELKALARQDQEPIQPAPSLDAPAFAYWPTPLWRARPPLRRPVPYRPDAGVVPPGWSVVKPGNAQLMRPIVSSRSGRERLP